ncbi:hypothetical protein Vafri_18086 [Volvox africanus]|uniref:Uncharacterized protein n=1 Tax=Volvox africanus TaxID=51714 RepID=A0A8J4BLL0_9CHLO|nr:hypothetical protein Vafri_18086 [Volvox africanus]
MKEPCSFDKGIQGMATKMDGCSHAVFPRGDVSRKDRRASLVIKETAQLLTGLHEDASRSSALMVELEALLAASQVASRSTAGQASLLTSANFIAAQPLEVSSEDDDCYQEEGDAEFKVVDDLSQRRLKTMHSIHRTASVVNISGEMQALCIQGTSASFSTRSSYQLPPPTGASATSPEGRRALSFCNGRASSYTLARSGPSQNGIKSAYSSGPPSASYARGTTTTGYGAPSVPEDAAGMLSQQGHAGSASSPTKRRAPFLAWVTGRSPPRRISGTVETATAGASSLSTSSPPRRSTGCDITGPKTSFFVQRSASNSHGTFLPRLNRRGSEETSSGDRLSSSGGGKTPRSSLNGGLRTAR